VVLAFASSDHVQFADGSGRVRSDISTDGPTLAATWSADGRHFAWLDKSRLHIVEAATGQDHAQPCPCSGLDRLGDRFATLSADGNSLLLFDPKKGPSRVPLPRTMSYATVVAGGRDEVAVTEPVPEEIADFRGQNTLRAIDAHGTIRPMLEGTSRTSVYGGNTSPDGKQITTLELLSSGACWNDPGVFVLNSAGTNPQTERLTPTDGRFTAAKIDEDRTISNMSWADNAAVVTFGPACQIPYSDRYITYAVADRKWTYLRHGVLEAEYGADGRSYAIELDDHHDALTKEPRGGTLVITERSGARHDVVRDVIALWITPAEQAAGHATPANEADKDVTTSDHGAPIADPILDLAQNIDEALNNDDQATLAELCAKCDLPTQQLLQTKEGRQQLARTLHTHPAFDGNSVTYPGLVTNPCVDDIDATDACTKEQIHDAGVLDASSTLEFEDPGSGYSALVTGSVRIILDDSGTARWVGQSTSARAYAQAADNLDERQYFFMSPDGAFFCGFNSKMAACQGETAPVPPRSSSCSPEGPREGHGMYVDAKQADFLCAGDPIFYPIDGEPSGQDRIAQGQTLAAAGFTCRSEDAGITCLHDDSRHGFHIEAHTGKIF
jgi:hypothetical protein